MMTSYHFIGIGGIGMSGLAHLLLEQKAIVTGSDITINSNTEKLIQEGAIIYKGHAASQVPILARVVHSTDIKSDNPEWQMAQNRGNILLHRSDLLAELIEGKRSLAVAGTHGKTTTSSLLASTLVEAGLDPSFAVGGMILAFDANARAGKSDWFVLEADESDGTFTKYHPFGAIVTNIDHDHLNHYQNDFSKLTDAFQVFMNQVKDSSLLFWSCDDPTLRQFRPKGQSYGFHPESDWRIENVQQQGFSMHFDLCHKNEVYKDIALSLIGIHNASNAAAVFGLARSVGIEEHMIRKSFKNFSGVARRCQQKENGNGILVIDDYAHHPTEIRTTIKGIKTAIEGRRCVAVFQPHRYTRTQECMGMYGDLFNEVDELIITDIYSGGESPIPHLSGKDIEKEVQSFGKVSCRYVPRTALSHFLGQFLRSGDVVVTLGAGDITKLFIENPTMVCS
jgi:UDP-N-acetylmuramate--alanine ligase